MHITILGAGGFLGRKLAIRLAHQGSLGARKIASLTLFDLAEPPAPPNAPFPVHTIAGDLTALPPHALPPGTTTVIHLAAVVSAQAEADYDLGLNVNLHGTLRVIDACRRLTQAGEAPPRLVFTSSVASFSGGQTAVLADDARQIPANSYGAEKAAAELLLADASRRGFLDAVLLRLPTITVRPGRPNRAASSFLSAILREPLLGLPTDLPVLETFAAWIASPRRAVEWLIHAAWLDSTTMGLDRSVNPPGLRTTVADMLAVLETIRPGAKSLVHPKPDADIAAIVNTWPAAFNPRRALALGFTPHEPLVDLVRAFAADDLAATRADRGLGEG
ncbi:MAG: NAD-dependent epimerase/dehydratase family protein [Acetobacteraceae bacterium]